MDVHANFYRVTPCRPLVANTRVTPCRPLVANTKMCLLRYKVDTYVFVLGKAYFRTVHLVSAEIRGGEGVVSVLR